MPSAPPPREPNYSTVRAAEQARQKAQDAAEEIAKRAIEKSNAERERRAAIDAQNAARKKGGQRP